MPYSTQSELRRRRPRSPFRWLQRLYNTTTNLPKHPTSKPRSANSSTPVIDAATQGIQINYCCVPKMHCALEPYLKGWCVSTRDSTCAKMGGKAVSSRGGAYVTSPPNQTSSLREKSQKHLFEEIADGYFLPFRFDCPGFDSTCCIINEK